MLKVFFEMIGAIGGTSVVVIGLATWLGKIWATRIIQKEVNKYNIEMEAMKASLQKEIDKSKYQLEIIKDSSIRYSEYQFKLYNELWGELYSLQIISDDLWERATRQNLSVLAKQLKKTKDQVKKNALLIEETHLLELMKILDEFGNYQMGKKKLIELRDTDQNSDNYEIQRLIDNNGAFKQRYSSIILRLESQFRRQLKHYESI